MRGVMSKQKTETMFAQELKKLPSFGMVKFGVLKENDTLLPYIEVDGKIVSMSSAEVKQVQKITIDFFCRPGAVNFHTRLEFTHADNGKGKGWRAAKYEINSVGRHLNQKDMNQAFHVQPTLLGHGQQWSEKLHGHWHMKPCVIENVPPTIYNTCVTDVESFGANVTPIRPSVAALR
jgi:hypothetical protein